MANRMKRIPGYLFNRWTMALLGLVALALLIWFAGPLIAIAEYRPLESEAMRWTLIILVFVFYAGRQAWRIIKAKKLNTRLLEGLLHHPPASPKPDNEAGAEEVATLRKRFEEAVAMLKQGNVPDRAGKSLSGFFVRRQYVYELPWYVFIGPPGSGKTTALVNSGLRFPFAERFGQEAVRGIGGTRNCDWWFTDEAVLLDTAGRYTTHESNKEADSAAWTGFLQLLKKYRPRRPINGAIVTISMADLMQQTRAQQEAQAAAIRSRIQELQTAFGMRFPIYVLVTKADLLAGFMEFFGEFGREERNQVWGATFTSGEQPDAAPVAGFHAEFSALVRRLEDQLIDHLQRERDPQRRALIYVFPQQFSSLGKILGDFMNQVFSPSRFEQQPLLRGFYFTSGTQEGNPIDRMLGAMARSMHLERKLLAPNRPSGKSFFLTRLLRDVVIAEAGLAGTDPRWERRHAWLQRGGFAALGLVTLGAIIAWSVSYSSNKTYLAGVAAAIPPILERVEDLPVLQNLDIASLLPVLDSVRNLGGTYNDAGEAATSMGFGLNQSDKIVAAARNTHQRLLRDALLPQLVLRIERLLSRSGRAHPDLLYETLKAYLMLHQPEHFDPIALKAFIAEDWEISLPREVTVEQRSRLESHLDDLLAQGPVPSPIPPNEQLIANVRHTVSQIPLAQRSYHRLKQLGAGADLPEFTIARAVGVSAPLVFSRISGQPLTRGVPGLFSYDGYHNAFSSSAQEITRQLAREEIWVLGVRERERRSGPDASGIVQLLDGTEQARLLDEVRRLYLEDYARTWEAFIGDIGLRRAGSLQESIRSARLLSAADSPLAALMRAIVREVTLIDVEDADKSLADKAADKARSARDELKILLGRTDSQASPAASGTAPERIVDDRFRELRSMVRPPAPGQTAPIDAIAPQINELYVLLTATDAAIQGGSKPPQSDVPAKIKAEAGRMPNPVRTMLATLASGGIAQALGETRNNLNQALRTVIGDFCGKAIHGRYPFAKNSARDVTQDDFSRLFSPGGLLDDFFQKNLAQYVDTSSRSWSFRRTDDGGTIHAPAALQEFRRAQVIRDTFFRDGGRAPGMRLVFKPIEMDASITQFILDVDGQLVKYSHGPQVPVELQWPGPRGSSQVRLQVSPASTSGASGQVFEGPWALFRMLDGVRIDPTSQPEKFVVTFDTGGRRARFEVTTSSVQNPFRLNELERFRCPEHL